MLKLRHQGRCQRSSVLSSSQARSSRGARVDTSRKNITVEASIDGRRGKGVVEATKLTKGRVVFFIWTTGYCMVVGTEERGNGYAITGNYNRHPVHGQYPQSSHDDFSMAIVPQPSKSSHLAMDYQNQPCTVHGQHET